MVKAQDAISAARSLIGTPYKELDCIGLIVRVIRTSPGGVGAYRTAGTNTLWKSAEVSAKYRDLTWRQEGIAGAQAGMLAFKRRGTDVHHVGLVTGDGTVIHSSSAAGKVVETKLDDTWQLLAVHRYIEVQELQKVAAPTAPSEESLGDETEDTSMEAYKMKVVASSLNVRNEPGIGGDRIGRISEGAVVTVQAEMENGWKYITYGDGAQGYVDGSYLAEYVEPPVPEAPKITIIDSANNHFCPVGDWRVLVGSVD
ncbi:MAG: SH3 domain-containing protein [Candidatus Ventricola sp.]|nr:SH3 domain-containing protein [Candidatus Ventricola sp.]